MQSIDATPRFGRLFWVLLPGILVLAIGLLTLTPAPVGVLHDDAVYVILAKSLATGHGYRYLNLPGEPAATHFPPGYPVFLAALWRIAPSFPQNLILFKAANVALLVASFALLAQFIRRRFGASLPVANTLAAIATVGVPTLLLTGLVLSEPLFLAIALLGLLVAEDVTSHAATARQAIVLGLLCGVAALVRSAGIALLGAAVLRLVLSRRYRDASMTTLAALVLLVPWQLWVRAHGNSVPPALQGAYGPYTTWFVDAIRQQGIGLVVTTLGQTSRATMSFAIDTICPFAAPAARVAAGLLLGALVAIGAWRAWHRAPTTLLFVAAYLALVLAWPVPPERYIWGVWPLLVVFPGLGIAEIARWRPRAPRFKLAQIGFAGLASLTLLGYASYTLTGYRERAWRNIPINGGEMLRPVVRTVRSRVGDRETVAVTAEAAVYLYSGRQSVPIYSLPVDPLYRTPSVAQQADAIGAIVSAYPVDVVVASTPLQRAAIRRLAASAPGKLTLRDSTADDLIFERSAP